MNINWLQVVIAFALGVLLSVSVKAAVTSAKSKVTGG